MEFDARSDRVIGGASEIYRVEVITGIHEAQRLTSMKLAGAKIGLLINFNNTRLKDGMKRFVL